MNQTYIDFCKRKRQEALAPVKALLENDVVEFVEFNDRSVSLHVGHNVIEFTGWGDDCDQGLDVSLNGKSVEDYFGSDFDNEFIGPQKPSMTDEERTAYRASLGPLQTILYDEYERIAKSLNDTSLLLSRLENKK